MEFIKKYIYINAEIQRDYLVPKYKIIYNILSLDAI